MRFDHVITLTDKVDGTVSMMYHDLDCGYVFGSSSFADAAYFTLEDAEQVVDKLLKEVPRASMDGTIFPPDYLHRGLHMSNANPKAFGVLAIEKIELVVNTNHEYHVEGEIKKPTGFTYD